jgi:hypothetical protein
VGEIETNRGESGFSELVRHIREEPPVLKTFETMADHDHGEWGLARSLGQVEIAPDRVSRGVVEFKRMGHGPESSPKRRDRATPLPAWSVVVLD